MGGVIRPVIGGLLLSAAATGWLAQAPVWAEDPASRCNAQPMQPAQIRCFLEAAQAAGDPGLCASAGDAAVRFNCLSLYAERSLDPASCELIEIGDKETQALRDACVSGVAIAQRDPDLCEEARLPVMRDACYMNLVVQFAADPTLCGRIANKTLHDACTADPVSAE
jgi:hypothetical protein